MQKGISDHNPRTRLLSKKIFTIAAKLPKMPPRQKKKLEKRKKTLQKDMRQV